MRAFLKVTALVLCIILVFPVCACAASKTLTLITPPSKADFYEGEDWMYIQDKVYPKGNFDLTGTVIRYGSTDISYYVFPWGANMWCQPVSGAWKAGANEVNIYCEDVSGACVTTTINLHTVSSISIESEPSQTNYIREIGWNYTADGSIAVDSIKLDGLKLNVSYSDGTRGYAVYDKDSADIAVDVPDYGYQFQLGQNTVYVSYSGKYAGFNINIELERITKVYAVSAPRNSSCAFGDDWFYHRGVIEADVDLSGFEVALVYNNGFTENILYDDFPERFSTSENFSYKKGANYISVLFDGEYPLSVAVWLEMFGDVNYDSSVNSTDALCILKYAAGTMNFDEDQVKYADVTADGKVNSADALDILRRSAGLIELFEAEI